VVTLRGGMGAKTPAAALARLQPQPGGPPLPPSRPARTPGRDSTAPRWTVSSSPRPSPRRGDSSSMSSVFCAHATARVRYYHDELTGGVVASSLAKRAPGNTSLGFPTPGNSPTHPVPTRRPRPDRGPR